MQTVGDVIEFWKNWCEKEGTMYLSEIYKGCEFIADDPEYWGNEPMPKLRDRVWDIMRTPSEEEIKEARKRSKAHPNLPDARCISRPDGSCVGGLMAGLGPCLHD